MNISLILHPVQYSADGRHVAVQALALAQLCHSDLHFLHVRSRRQSRDQETAEQMRLRKFVIESDEKQVSFQEVILYGDPVTAVAEYAQSVTPDLIVVGNRGQLGSTLWRPGAYAKELATEANCPTLMVKADEHRPNTDAEFSFKNILCATDFSHAASAALKQALLFALQRGGRITLLHVLEGYPPETVYSGSRAPKMTGEYHELVSWVSRELHNSVPSDVVGWCDVQTRVGIGIPYRTILSTASQVNADLIVIGLPVRARFDAALMGSTTALVAQRASCPVMMVPGLPSRTSESRTANATVSESSRRAGEEMTNRYVLAHAWPAT